MKRFLLGLTLLPLIACAPSTAPGASYFPFRDGELISFDASYGKQRVKAQLVMRTTKVEQQNASQWSTQLDQKGSDEVAGLLVDTRNDLLLGFLSLDALVVAKVGQAKIAYCIVRSYKAGTRVTSVKGTTFIGTLSQFLDDPELAMDARNPCTMTVNAAATIIHVPSENSKLGEFQSFANIIERQLEAK
jgi:hypothetical protein